MAIPLSNEVRALLNGPNFAHLAACSLKAKNSSVRPRNDLNRGTWDSESNQQLDSRSRVWT